MKDINKIRGALYGVAVGDALGAPLEFMNAAEIQTKYGTVRDMLPGGWLNVEPGEVTDDTQMTLAVGSGILVCADDPVPYIGKRFILWTMRGPKDIGGTCAGSIAIARAKADQHTMLLSRAGWVQAARRARPNNKNADGNGALMRTVYPGLFYGYIDDAQMHAGDIAEMTHAGVISKETCILYTSMIYYIINNDFCVSARDMITALVKRYDNTEQENLQALFRKRCVLFSAGWICGTQYAGSA